MTPVEWAPAPVPAAAGELARDGVRPPLAELLARRGVVTAAGAAAFLEPSLDQLHDPLSLAGVPAAVERLAAARERRERVAVVGDYDVDGVTGTALLVAVLRHAGLEVEPILPHRLREGYGFQGVHVDRATALACRVIVTVDCGASSGEAARGALEAGIDVIVTDHHLPGGELPDGVIQINPRQSGCVYPCQELSGAGIAFKLAQAVAGRLGRQPPVESLLRIACLGTIADLVPLVGENRTIAALGLRALESARSPGLRALIRQAGIRPPFSADDVGYRLGPRINAAGRLDDAAGALELLLTRDRDLAAELALRLDRWNRERQEAESQVVEEAREAVRRRGRPAPIVVAWSDRWHRGVVGIAAGRLARDLHRPAVLLAVAGDEAVGSGRSIPGIELHGFLLRWRHEMVRFGGHAQAVGLTVEPERLEGLRAHWEETSGAEWPEELFARRHEYELALGAEGVGPELLEGLLRLEPHGQGNPRP
ncbi:MAG TPA: single-stranded-DNA-specific exonuclease RecJ, partial [Thermoanaerobaculia bacterium]|nr:single-stranded-DNA-specific exonuclease RecJ [Thermoanaerobaculia bacterium]